MTQVSSLYLHVPFCQHLCNYCDFYKKAFDQPTRQIEEFHQFLASSLLRHDRLLEQYAFNWSALSTIYLGGGTPSLWGKSGAEFFQQCILSGKEKPSQLEFTMEVDPGTWTLEMIDSWKKLGLNRISIGTQSLDPRFIKIMDRKHSLQESRELLSFCQQGKWNFSLDLLLGIPYSRQEKRDIRQELDQLLSFEPKHISLYILNARSKYPLIAHMPDDEFIREEYLLVSQYLRQHGFHHYEVSNFALPGFESQHNLKYWRGEAVAALGPTATGYLPLAKDQAVRYKWKVSKAEVEVEPLAQQELHLERTYLSLRTSHGWKPENFHLYSTLFERWQEQHYATVEGERVKLTALGFLMLDSLMDDLFRAGL